MAESGRSGGFGDDRVFYNYMEFYGLFADKSLAKMSEAGTDDGVWGRTVGDEVIL
jgi:hypothetical protein